MNSMTLFYLSLFISLGKMAEVYIGQEAKRLQRKKKSPANFRLNKVLVRADSSDEVLSVVGESLSDFNIVNIGTALYRLALVSGNMAPNVREQLRSDERFGSLIDEIVETLEADSQAEVFEKVCPVCHLVSSSFVGSVGTEGIVEYYLGGN